MGKAESKPIRKRIPKSRKDEKASMEELLNVRATMREYAKTAKMKTTRKAEAHWRKVEAEARKAEAEAHVRAEQKRIANRKNTQNQINQGGKTQIEQRTRS